jgi:hypothetical protein
LHSGTVRQVKTSWSTRGRLFTGRSSSRSLRTAAMSVIRTSKLSGRFSGPMLATSDGSAENICFIFSYAACLSVNVKPVKPGRARSAVSTSECCAAVASFFSITVNDACSSRIFWICSSRDGPGSSPNRPHPATPATAGNRTTTIFTVRTASNASAARRDRRLSESNTGSTSTRSPCRTPSTRPRGVRVRERPPAPCCCCTPVARGSGCASASAIPAHTVSPVFVAGQVARRSWSHLNVPIPPYALRNRARATCSLQRIQ